MKKIETWIATTLFALGVIIGLTYLNVSMRMKSETDDSPPAVSQHDKNRQLDESLSLELSKQVPRLEKIDSLEGLNSKGRYLEEGDNAFLGGNYATAIRFYYHEHKSTSNAGAFILLREAMCFEKQKEFALATKRYTLAISASENQTQKWLAVAGVARCSVELDDPHTALGFFSRHVLILDSAKDVHEEAVAQIQYGFATVLQKLATDDSPILTDPFGVAVDEYSIRGGAYLTAIDYAFQSDTNALAEQIVYPKIQILQKPSQSAQVIILGMWTELESISEIIAQVCAESELVLNVSPKAQAALAGHSKTIRMKAVPLSSLLDQLLIPQSLVWFQVGTELTVLTNEELDPSIEAKQVYFDAAVRAYRQFELRFQDNDRMDNATLAAIGIDILQNQLDSAVNRIQELYQAQPTGEILAKLFFNEAKVKLLRGDRKEAKRLLYLASDQSFLPEIESNSYCLLGSLHLADGELDNAISASRRAFSLASDDQPRSYSALNLARAFVLKNEPYLANNALFQARESFSLKHEKAMAALLGSYAQYIGLDDELGMRTARNRLLTALTMTPIEDFRSFADCYIASSAYERLGFRKRAINQMLLALSQPDVGNWQRLIILEMSGLQHRNQETESAIQALTKLIEVDDEWTPQALELLAKLYAEVNDSENCITTCRRLWQLQLDERQKKMTLQILGDAYQLQGEHHAAALCFAGMLPNKF